MCSHLGQWHRYASGEQNAFEKSLTELTLCSGQETQFLEHANMIPQYNGNFNTCLPNNYLILKIPFFKIRKFLNISKDSSFSFTCSL
jgi:hypothetical protein